MCKSQLRQAGRTINPRIIAHISDCVFIFAFLSRGRERLLPSARYIYRSLLQSSDYFAHTFSAPLSLLIPTGFLTITAYSCLR